MTCAPRASDSRAAKGWYALSSEPPSASPLLHRSSSAANSALLTSVGSMLTAKTTRTSKRRRTSWLRLSETASKGRSSSKATCRRTAVSLSAASSFISSSIGRSSVVTLVVTTSFTMVTLAFLPCAITVGMLPGRSPFSVSCALPGQKPQPGHSTGSTLPAGE